jgi:hypothetical protein
MAGEDESLVLAVAAVEKKARPQLVLASTLRLRHVATADSLVIWVSVVVTGVAVRTLMSHDICETKVAMIALLAVLMDQDLRRQAQPLMASTARGLSPRGKRSSDCRD